ncbi:uncharacterized protein LOC110985938 isoform X1 [Acanthaster planci]|uniref:Uncharacterized protein LOC110985938 isoform X1 n=1 Tax=Acanthaster planci TaxID=133434 RepID=A0A8B7ZDP4_ACAPL|nr:uncharacterized protein LOC110985938 isoform X1 [Acanthaster planci]
MADAEYLVTDKDSKDVDPELGLTNTAFSASEYGSRVNRADPIVEPPPLAYDELPRDAPPSYQSIFGKIQDAKMTSPTPVHFVIKIIGILLSTVFVTVFLAVMLALPIAMIVMGALYKDDCPVEPKIPIYLIVNGSVGIVKSLLDLIVRCGRLNQEDNNTEEQKSTKGDICSHFLGCFLFAFFIAGNVWVYSNYPPSDIVSDPNYCYGPLYYFAFWFMTSCYILLGVFFCLECCLICVAVCKDP